MDEALKARLDAVESRAKVLELPVRYAWASARADVAGMAALFTEDCDFETGPPDQRLVLKGRAAFTEAMEKLVSQPGAVIALVQNQTAETSGDTGSGTCVMYNPVAPAAASPFIGYFKDRFQRVNGVWLFSARCFRFYSPHLDLAD